MAAAAAHAQIIKHAIINLGKDNFRKLIKPNPGDTIASLPFPGLPLSKTGSWPPKVFDFVARQDYATLLIRLYERITENPDLSLSCGICVKGSGKSCFLRAFAILLVSAQIPKVRIICIWYLDAEASLVPQITAALYFAFSDDAEAVARIGSIDSPKLLDEFLKERFNQGEKLVFLIDGAERYDMADTDDVAIARGWLDVFYKWSRYRFQTLSPNARAPNDTEDITEDFNCLFTKEYNTFLTTCKILGPMLKENLDRAAVVEHLAGRHPMSLYLLEGKCAQYVESRTGNVSNEWTTENPFALAILKLMRKVDLLTEADHPSPVLDLGHKLLEDPEDWNEVVSLFREDENFREMRKKPDLLQGFLLPVEGACTPFIRGIGLQTRLMRRESHVYRTPQVRGLLAGLLTERDTVWPQVGYISEGIVAEAVLDAGFCFRGVMHRPDRVECLLGKPKLITASDLEANEKDVHGMLHFWFLQVCLNPGAHRGTELKFVQREAFKQWTNLDNPFKLYYVYVCPKPTSVPSEDYEEKRGIPEKTKKRKGTQADTDNGTVAYAKAELALDRCLRLAEDEIELLTKLGKLRDRLAIANENKARKKQRCNERDERLGERQKYRSMFRRPELERIAQQCGIKDASSKRKYPSIPDLILAIPLETLVRAEAAKINAKGKARQTKSSKRDAGAEARRSLAEPKEKEKEKRAAPRRELVR